MSDADLDPGRAALSDALAALVPRPPALDRDRILFEAGRRAQRRWTRLGSAGALAGFALSAILALRAPEPLVVERLVFLPVPEATAPPATSPIEPPQDPPGGFAGRDGAAPYPWLLAQMLKFGPDCLPAPNPNSLPALALPRGEEFPGLPRDRWIHQLQPGDS